MSFRPPQSGLFNLITATDKNAFVTFCLSARYKAVYSYKPQNGDELELREGDIVQVMEKCDDGWFVGKLFYYIVDDCLLGNILLYFA